MFSVIATALGVATVAITLASGSSTTAASGTAGDIADGDLITFALTDSVSLGTEAINDIRGVIRKLYGADALPASPRLYKTKSKNAQEAHEGVRPTSAARTPEMLAGKIDADEHV